MTTLLGDHDHLPRIDIHDPTSKPHDTIQVVYRRFRWHLSINGRVFMRSWNRSDAVVLANFLARLAAPSTLYISPGPSHPTAERMEF